MEIIVNGNREEVEEGMTVTKLLIRRGVKPELVAVEVNDRLLERQEYADVLISPGDRVEFLYYMGGGCRRKALGRAAGEICSGTRMEGLLP